VKPDDRYSFVLTGPELNIILDALLQYQGWLSYQRPRSATSVNRLRRSLLVSSVAQDGGDEWGMAVPALPPEST